MATKMNDVDGAGIPLFFACGASQCSEITSGTDGCTRELKHLEFIAQPLSGKYTCPTGFKVRTERLPSMRSFGGISPPDTLTTTIKGKTTTTDLNGKIKVKSLCPKSSTNNFVQVCELEKFEDDDNKAMCYMGEMPRGPLGIVGARGGPRGHRWTHTNISKCPDDFKDPGAIKQFMRGYCSKVDNIDKGVCNKFWGTDSLETRDDAYVAICRGRDTKNDPRCACINAVPPKDVPASVAWIFDQNCGDPTINAWRTQHMNNVTFQDCRQYWTTTGNDNTILRNNTMEQSCTLNFPGETPQQRLPPPTAIAVPVQPEVSISAPKPTTPSTSLFPFLPSIPFLQSTPQSNLPVEQTKPLPSQSVAFNPDSTSDPGPSASNPSDHPSDGRVNILPINDIRPNLSSEKQTNNPNNTSMLFLKILLFVIIACAIGAGVKYFNNNKSISTNQTIASTGEL